MQKLIPFASDLCSNKPDNAFVLQSLPHEILSVESELNVTMRREMRWTHPAERTCREVIGGACASSRELT